MKGPIKITSRISDVDFNVRLVEHGDSYLADGQRHLENDPLVEFWDATSAGDPRFGPLGQFVARYYASTLLARRPDLGLDLLTYEPAWKIDAAALGMALRGLGVWKEE